MTSFDDACSIVKQLYEEGFTAYFAGGWVRDYIMDHPSDDIDIATDASVQEVQRIFPKTIPVGVNFGIVIVVQEGHHFEVATFRKDQGYKDGRRPVGVTSATSEEDALRRDFTINGMFYDPIKEELFDFVSGQEDLQKGIIRAIGNPHERFLEDRLRMIRAVRYASRFHFKIEEETLKAIIDHAEDLFPAVAIERVWSEFTKMAAFPNFDKALVTLHRLNLLPVIFPQLKNTSIEEVQNRLKLLPSFPEQAPLIAKILELFPLLTLEEKIDLCRTLKLSKHDLNFTTFYHRATAIFQDAKRDEKELFEWAHFYAHPFYQICLEIAASHLPLEARQAFLQEHHLRYDQLKTPINMLKNKVPFISSEDLRLSGIPNGKQMGILLKEGERLAINHSLGDSNEVIERLKQTPLWELHP